MMRRQFRNPLGEHTPACSTASSSHHHPIMRWLTMNVITAWVQLMSAMRAATAASKSCAGSRLWAGPDAQIQPGSWITLQRGKTALSPPLPYGCSIFVRARTSCKSCVKMNNRVDRQKADLPLHCSTFSNSLIGVGKFW